MRTLHTLIFGLLITVFSCRQPDEKTIITVVRVDSSQTTIHSKEQEPPAKRRKIDEQDIADSIRLDKVLQDALKIANQNIARNRFVKKYEVLPDSVPITVEINLGYHFSNTNPHLIIRRNEPSTVYIDVYSESDSEFKNVLSHEEWTMTYVSDTIRDINGDGIKDFVVNWYGSNGCCLKAFSNVYLIRQDKKSFSGNFEFINPTFSPKEKIIRGVEYGHPGETEMYKYKWIGEKVDTLEYVSFQKNDKGEKTGKILIHSNRKQGDPEKTLKVLNSVPTEYKKIEGYDWFLGDLFK